MDVQMPDASFYLWPKIDGCDLDFAQRLFAEQHITALPGQLLSRSSAGINPGQGHIRIALVATLEECLDAAQRIKGLCRLAEFKTAEHLLQLLGHRLSLPGLAL